MATGDQAVRIYLKKFLTQQELENNFFFYLENQIKDAMVRAFGVDGVFEPDIGSNNLFSSSAVDTFDLPNPLIGIDGLGNILNLDPTFGTQVPFENDLGVDYFVALRWNFLFRGTEVNVRTGEIEYTFREDQIGEKADPDAVVDDGDGTLTITVDSVCEPGVSHAGRTCVVYLKDPITQADTFEELTVIFSGGANKIETTTALGQVLGNISTDASDYEVFLRGPSVRRNTDLSLDDNVLFLGKVTGAGAGNSPTSFDQSGANDGSDGVVEVNESVNAIDAETSFRELLKITPNSPIDTAINIAAAEFIAPDGSIFAIQNDDTQADYAGGTVDFSNGTVTGGGPNFTPYTPTGVSRFFKYGLFLDTNDLLQVVLPTADFASKAAALADKTDPIFSSFGVMVGIIVVEDNGTGGSGTIENINEDDIIRPSTNALASPGSAGGGVSELNDLTDVDTTGETTGDVLRFNGSIYVPVLLALSNLDDVDLTGLVTGDVLEYNGADFVPVPRVNNDRVRELVCREFTVGSAAEVTDGKATHSSIGSAITAAVAGDSILLLPGTFPENIVLSKSLHFLGCGNLSDWDGTLQLSAGASFSTFERIRHGGNITIDNGVTGCFIINGWLDAGATVNDNNPDFSDLNKIMLLKD